MKRYEVTAVTFIGEDSVTIRRPVATSDQADMLACKFARDGFLVSIIDLVQLGKQFPTLRIAG